MDQSNKRNKKDKRFPRVPIKTYKWEDIRRSRRKGGYPWTYLYKQPFDEELDTEPFTMEALRKSKSASTLSRSREVEISEITAEPTNTSFNRFLEVPEKTGNQDTVQIITEPDDHSMKNSTGSLVIEECEMSDNGSHNPEYTKLESADSSDNISQYLDKEERVPEKTDQLEDMQGTGDVSEVQDVKNTNLKEESNRKRKLSGESSHSKISFSKLAMIKKIKETKNKIKVPKLTFPTSKLKKPTQKKNKSSPPETKKDIRKSSVQPKQSKPVYIHIPLKPPDGETDEFSHLEFEDPDKKLQIKKLGSFRDVVKNVKQLQGAKLDENVGNVSQSETTDDKLIERDVQTTIINEPDIKSTRIEEPDIKSTRIEEIDVSTTEIKDIETKIPSDENTSISIQSLQESNTSDNKQDEVLSSEDKDEKHQEETSSQNKTTDTIPTAIANDTTFNNEAVKEDRRNSFEMEEIDTTLMEEDDEIKTGNELFDKLFESRASSSRENDVEIVKPNQVRSKSAEPERRRKLSLESSYSRKSLSKLGILKKLKETTDKIKNSLSRSNSKKQSKPEKPEKPRVQKEIKTLKKLTPEKPVQPVYIHIPLKPLEGETDEFSYLEFGDKKPLQKEEDKEISSSLESPVDSPVPAKGVQFIILTAPSDDEILDYHSSDVPETPSSENKLFFGNKIEELKELAKDIVDEMNLSSSKKLDTLSEESNSDKIKTEEVDNKNEVAKECIQAENVTDQSCVETEKMVIDEEDGLNESITKQEQILDVPLEKDVVSVEQTLEPKIKSNLKDENSPVIKKKVSFKRRSKTPRSDSYEEIQVPKVDNMKDENKELDDARTPVLNVSQSMSVDEEKAYLDEKIIKPASLDEDYNKWSKISDHEYEPVNPPPDNETFPSPSPTVHIIDIDQEAKYVQPISETDIIATKVATKDEPSNKTEPNDFTSTTTSTPGIVTDKPSQESTSLSDKNKEGPSKFKLALKQTTDQFKSKLHNMKKPHITIPDKSKFRKFKIEKPKFNFPKIPDTAKVNLPSFSLSGKSSTKRSLKERQLSTESNDGDSKKPIFDFSTYPRIFKKKPKTVDQTKEKIPDFATAPRAAGKKNSQEKSEATVTWGGTDAIRIPLHSEESVDADFGAERETVEDETNKEPHQMVDQVDDESEDSVERRMASHIRYEKDIDIEDEYEREPHDINKSEYLSRWDHGNFNSEPLEEYLKNYKNSQYKVTDLDSPDDVPSENNFNTTNNNKETYSSGSSLGMQRVGGVLEEIDSDEFFLRQKGISQDNIEVGMLLSSEIREAFRTPDNALSKMQDLYRPEYNPRGSNQSLPGSQNKRKPIKKPKRKKTPHASHEKIPYAEESCDEDILPPSRPKRRSKRVHKHKNNEVIPYQETIPPESNDSCTRLLDHRESLGILGDDEQEIDTSITFENEVRQGKQPDTKKTDPYQFFEYVNKQQYDENLMKNNNFEDKPAAPPRKQKSLRSLNLSENDSISGDLPSHKYNADIEIEQRKTNAESSFKESPHAEYRPEEPPRRPSRMRSHTSSQSVIISQPDEDNLSKRRESLTSENQTPCVEEPCIQDIRDYMGYAIIDKNKVRDPPLPPPRLPARQKRSIKSNKEIDSDTKFFTVPRPVKDTDMPVRPLRNYSTLGQTRKVNDTVTYENKENIDITQYIEIEDEPNRDLHSGEVLKRMKDRPLPAPPRPPRKCRPLRDITSEENIMLESMKDEEGKSGFEEFEASTQTEPLPDDFVCEDVIPEVSDTILSPSNVTKFDGATTVEKQDSIAPEANSFVERRLITPTYYTQEETITHGSLLVEPINGSRILPDSELTSVSKERIIPITTDSDGETSSIPEDFKNLKNPSQEGVTFFTNSRIERNKSQPQNLQTPEVSIVKTQKLQVSDLDVDTLTVKKLMAEKIVVSEIDSASIQTNEIHSKAGALKVGELELPSGVLQQILNSITSTERQSSGIEVAASQREERALKDESREEKKTPINNLEIETVQYMQTCSDSVDNYTERQPSNDNAVNYVYDEQSLGNLTDSIENTEQDSQNEPPQPPPRFLQSEEIIGNFVAEEESDEYPQRPPRQCEKNKNDSSCNIDDVILEPDVDDEPPPRPPEPLLDYLPSQPPPSFYALKAENYVNTLEDNIPVVPRRRRQPKSKPIPRSSSEESEVTPVSRRYHSRTSETSITQLSGQLVRACASQANTALKRLITHVTGDVLHNADGKQDLHVMVIILLVLIAGLILLGYGDEKTVVHLHHWEFFNPPRDM